MQKKRRNCKTKSAEALSSMKYSKAIQTGFAFFMLGVGAFVYYKGDAGIGTLIGLMGTFLMVKNL